MAQLDYGNVERNFLRVQDQIVQAAKVAGRDPATVKLVVVSKGHPVEGVRAALNAGVRVFGENYAQEGLSKKIACSGWAGVEWHMIGHVQSRKAKIVVEHYDWLHSLDSLKLARRLDRFASEFDQHLPVLLECNVSGEESKFGFSAWNEIDWPRLIEELSSLFELKNLTVRGLMTMAPFLEDPEGARPYFQRLRKLRDYLMEQFPHGDWSELSMGMSGDYPVAIEEGSTLVRIGTAILGRRPMMR